ncbi:MAG TPA: arylesterase [Alphaproteobacteria bacterium]|nr:arylesterase [Alphaproteobacteria bacterium]
MLFALALLAAFPALAEPLRILAFGDSLTAGFGLPSGQGFARQLEEALAEKGIAAEVIDAGVSGDTTAGGLARLDWSLADRPDLVILELGANDMLRGIDPAETRANLDEMLSRLRAAETRILLAGMRAAPNLGADYGGAFERIYGELAAKHGVPLYPFFLEGVAADPKFNLPDGLHPNAAGVAEIVRRILPHVIAAAEMGRS